MGALHQGHMSLIKEGLLNNGVMVVSIFVNPTQFDNADDLKKYPRTLGEDVALLKTMSPNIIVYAPSVDDIYEGNTVAQHFSLMVWSLKWKVALEKGILMVLEQL